MSCSCERVYRPAIRAVLRLPVKAAGAISRNNWDPPVSRRERGGSQNGVGALPGMPPCRLPLVVRPQQTKEGDQDAPLFRLVTPGGEPLGTIELGRHERPPRSVTRALQACARSRIPPHRIETGAHAGRVSQVGRGDSYPPNGLLRRRDGKAGPRLASSGLRHPPRALNAAPRLRSIRGADA